jgi:hypothetical protein
MSDQSQISATVSAVTKEKLAITYVAVVEATRVGFATVAASTRTRGYPQHSTAQAPSKLPVTSIAHRAAGR